jgi:hypothetical protein
MNTIKALAAPTGTGPDVSIYIRAQTVSTADQFTGPLSSNSLRRTVVCFRACLRLRRTKA